MKSINIAITDEGKLDLRCSEAMHVQEVLELTLNAQLASLKQVLDNTPEEGKELVKKDLFDMYNLGASNILAAFAPEFEVHPELDIHEMLAKENEVIDRAYEEVVAKENAS